MTGHAVTVLPNRIAKRTCAYNYNCISCDFDQLFEEVMTPKTASTPFNVEKIKGFDVPMEYHFHHGHTWARIENGGYIRIGLDDFALKLLGEADAFDLPLMGKQLDQGTTGWGLKRKKNIADVLSPVDGVIMEVNSKIKDNPGLANREPYGDGWLFTVQTADIKTSVKSLMTATQSVDWIINEVCNLETMIEDVAGPLAADGGFLTHDIYGALPDLGWENLTKAFLKT